MLQILTYKILQLLGYELVHNKSVNRW